jgi:hypothetical protein
MDARGKRWMLIAAATIAAVGCGTTPPRPAMPAQPKAAVSQPWCPACAEQTRELERLRQDVASRDAELRELRSNQVVEMKVLQQSKREASRAKIKLRRLATRADAASYIAEVEVAIDSLRSSPGAKSKVREAIAAQRLLDSTATPFAQGDYGAAMDRAAEAEQLIAKAAGSQAREQIRATPRIARGFDRRVSPGRAPDRLARALRRDRGRRRGSGRRRCSP